MTIAKKIALISGGKIRNEERETAKNPRNFAFDPLVIQQRVAVGIHWEIKTGGHEPRRAHSSRMSQECAQSIHGFVGALFHQPMSGVLQNNHLNIGCDELHLRPEDRRACLFSSNRQNGHP
jgi:hypothetical protein